MQTKIPQWFYLSHVPRLRWELALSLSAVTTWSKALIPDSEYLLKHCLQFWSIWVHVLDIHLCRAGALPLSCTQWKGKGERPALTPPFLATLLSRAENKYTPWTKTGVSVMFLTDIYWSFKDENAGSGSWLSLLSHKGHSQKILSSPPFGLWKITPKGRNSLLCRSLPSPCSVCWCRGLGWTLDLSVWDAWPSKTPQQCSQCSLLVQPVTLDLGEEQDNFPGSSSLVMLQEPGCSTRTQWTGEISTERTRLEVRTNFFCPNLFHSLKGSQFLLQKRCRVAWWYKMLIKLLGRKLPWDATKQESSNVPLTSSFKWSSIAPQLFKVSLCFFTWCYSESKPDLNTINKLTKSGLVGQFGLFGGAGALCWVYLHNAELTFCIWNLK